MRPLVGITGRALAFGAIKHTDERFADESVNVFFSAFDRRVAEAGGVPVNLPFASAQAGAMDRLDALVVTGGQDVHPGRWNGQVVVDPSIDPRLRYDAHDVERDAYEEALIHAAIDLGKPVLVVCRGIQLLNVARGGSLVEDIVGTPIRHYSPATAPHPGHPDHLVATAPGSIVQRLYGAQTQVNSWHHQSVDVLGTGLVVTATTPDGVVEAVELPGHPVVGVQWHPEWMPDLDPVFTWLVEAASAYLMSPTNVQGAPQP